MHNKTLKIIYKVYVELGRFIGIFTGAYFAFGIYSYRYGFIENPLILYAVVLTSSILLLIYIFFLAWKRFITPLRYPFYIKSAKYSLEMTDNSTWQCKKNFLLVPQNDKQFRYLDRYFWSGSGEVVPTSPTPSVSVRHAACIEHMNYVDFCFNRFLEMGEEVELEVLLLAKDEEKVMQPYLEVKPRYPIKYLELSVSLPENVCPETAQWSEKRNRYPEGAKSEHGKKIFERGRVTKEFPKARMGYGYRLTWEYKNILQE